MRNTKFMLSIIIFSFLLFCTSIIKNKTRVIEKEIVLMNEKIINLEHNLYESQLDFHYLTSPKILQEKIQFLTNEKYDYIKFSKIYLDYDNFILSQKSLSKK